ncbi:hypothetical protein PDK09_27615 [Bacillus cereus]|nr:hypothetical protein [Bacillus cereus]MDA1769678.1 hypothetical protein [Bacillus cereus]
MKWTQYQPDIIVTNCTLIPTIQSKFPKFGENDGACGVSLVHTTMMRLVY